MDRGCESNQAESDLGWDGQVAEILGYAIVQKSVACSFLWDGDPSPQDTV
ncbi:MAG: hypothetical protein ABI945_02360 [Nitrospirales bacterium]